MAQRYRSHCGFLSPSLSFIVSRSLYHLLYAKPAHSNRCNVCQSLISVTNSKGASQQSRLIGISRNTRNNRTQYPITGTHKMHTNFGLKKYLNFRWLVVIVCIQIFSFKYGYFLFSYFPWS